MNVSDASDEICAALNQMEIRGEVIVEPLIRASQENRWKVTVNDRYFGIYDTDKKTFVD